MTLSTTSSYTKILYYTISLLISYTKTVLVNTILYKARPKPLNRVTTLEKI